MKAVEVGAGDDAGYGQKKRPLHSLTYWLSTPLSNETSVEEDGALVKMGD